jgi:hypothetical protein
MSERTVEYRYPIGGGSEGLLIFDGRVVEFFNLGSGGSIRMPYPECTVERSEPNRKGNVDFKFRFSSGVSQEFPVPAEAVAGFDAFVVDIAKATGR